MTSDDLFEQRLERQLRDYAARGAADTDGSAIARAMAEVPSKARVESMEAGTTLGVAGRRVTAASPIRGLLVAAALAIGLVGASFVVGGGSNRNVVAPTSTADVPASTRRPTPRLLMGVPTTPRNDLCPGATRFADIWDTSVVGNAMNHWIRSDLHPLEALGSGGVAIVVPVRRGATEVRILDPMTSRSCLLLELPGGGMVQQAKWSPSGDALAIALSDRSVYVWSAMGTTRPMALGGDTLSWSPDGSHLAVGTGPGLFTLANDGAAPIQLQCDPPGPNVHCPAFPRLLWSPNGDRLVMEGGDRGDSTKYGPASMLDPVFHLIPPVQALTGAEPIGWLDSQTLLEASDSSLFEVPVDDRTQFREHVVPNALSSAPAFSPDQRFAASGSFRDPVRVVDLETGRETVVIGATELGTDLFYSLEWTSDGRSLVVSVGRGGSTAATPLGLWVVNPDGSGLRKLISGDVVLPSSEDTQTAQAALRSFWGRLIAGAAVSAKP